jgi:dTDP-4-dehydrorhamnose 3,5-epimerase
MIEGVIVKKLSKFEDDRGWLMEIYRSDDEGYQPAMSYISLTKNGVVRGPHEHVRQTDCFVFAGPGTFELHLWDRREASPTFERSLSIVAGEDNPAMVIVPPGVVHGYKCISKKDALCINLPDKLYKGQNKQDSEVDEIRWEQKTDSPYQIK